MGEPPLGGLPMYSGARFMVFQPPWFRTLSVLRSIRRRAARILFVMPFVILTLSIGASLHCAEQPTRANTNGIDLIPDVLILFERFFCEPNLLTILDKKDEKDIPDPRSPLGICPACGQSALKGQNNDRRAVRSKPATGTGRGRYARNGNPETLRNHFAKSNPFRR